MKLLRYGETGRERPGILDANGNIRELGGVVSDIGDGVLTRSALDRLRRTEVESLPRVDGPVRIGPCVAGVRKLMGVGRNYAGHAAESGEEVPEEPLVFFKATSAICGPDDDVLLPPGSVKTDWEVELGVVIGDEARYVSESAALDHVAGYCVVTDISERHFQLERCGQWVKGKSCDTFAPIGPWLVTADEIPDPQNLAMWLDVNEHRYQDGSTASMVFGVRYLVSYLSQFMTLQSGDIICTGTPPGVGLGQSPPVYLKDGDVMTLEIEGLGRQRQPVRALPQ
ncbi:MAG: fumarylacetoacetate hydrolase family protein [Proteobacteria bacterium]|nr:fumarylacetoacetate hydrolase family protein [Pseudomonadota bacterium]